MSTTAGAASRSNWPANGIAAALDFSAASHRRAALLLVLVSLVAFLPGFFQIPPIDRDEAYFAQATKQMIETGDYVNIRYRQDLRYRKPIGIYWLQAAVVNSASALGMRNARTTIWLYRLPSLFGATGAVLATYWCGLAFVSRRGALVAALMMAASVALGVEARLAKTDAVLLLTVVVAMGMLARAYLAPRPAPASAVGKTPVSWRSAALFWTALAAGFLVKGPLVLMFVGVAAATVSIVDRSAAWLKALRPLPGIAWLCLLVLPWFIAIYLRAGNAFVAGSLGQDMLAKIGGGQETHGAPPGYYLVLFFLTFFPGSTLAIPAVPAVWARRRDPAIRFLLAWLVPSWIMFELVMTKLPHYVLPLYPAIAMLIAGVIEADALSQQPWLTRGRFWWFVTPLAVSGFAIVVSVIIGRNLDLLAWPFFAGAIICGLFAWRLFDEDGAERALLRAAAGAILMAIGLYAVVVPSLAPDFPSVALADVLHESACKQPEAASVGFEEPSLVFLAGTGTHMTDPSGAADFLLGGSCRFAFVDTAEVNAFARYADASGVHYRAGPRIEGFNISTGQRVGIAVFQSTDTP